MRVTDDLGATMELPNDLQRVVSLVPSLTESIAVSAPSLLVGATDWCTRPADLNVRRVRGTKNPDLSAIRQLAPDLVLANKEENRELDVRRLRDSGVAVWVTDIRSVNDALRSLRRMFTEALLLDVPYWLLAAEVDWAAPPPTTRMRVVVPIWRDPWMVVGPDTFTNDMITRLGLDNVYVDADTDLLERYPHTTADDIAAATPDVVLLPDEPYLFTAEDGPEAFPGIRCLLVEGRALTWYGPSMATAQSDLLAALKPTGGSAR